MSKFQAAAQILQAAKAQIKALLTGPDEELHRLRLEQTLQRESDYILMVTGTGDVQGVETPTLGPATTIGGKPISKIRKLQESDLLPSDDAVLNLKQQVESALVYFGPESNSAGILANIPDLVIRGVAKKAGLKVTKDEPKELTVEFIDEIKAALHARSETPVNPLLEVGKGGISEVVEVPIVDISLTNEQLPGMVENTKEPITDSELLSEELQPAKTAEPETTKTGDIAQPKTEKKKK